MSVNEMDIFGFMYEKYKLPETVKLFEAFSGIGCQRMAFDRLGIKYEMVGFSEIDKYAIQAYNAIHGDTKNYGSICDINGADLPEIDVFTYSFPCFTGNSLVMTNFGFKKIVDVKIGDKVLTHDNSFKEVVRNIDNGYKETIKIKGMGIDEIVCTPNHLFYTRELKRIYYHNPNTQSRIFEQPKWVEAKDLTKNNYLGIAINQNSIIPILPKEIDHLSKKKDFWYIVGRYLGDGWLRYQGGIIICCNFKETKEITDKLDSLSINYCISKERTVNKIHISKNVYKEYFAQFGRGAKNKRITQDVFDLPIHLLEGLIEGYLDADGAFTQGLYKTSSVSKELSYGFAQCVAKAYKIPFRLYKGIRKKDYNIEGRTGKQLDAYQVVFKKDVRKQDKAFYEDGYIWFPINAVEKGEIENVYDLEVKENHSYTVNGVIVHNCTDLSKAGKQKGLGDTRSGLVYEVLRILQQLNDLNRLPKVLIMENVVDLVQTKFIRQFQEIQLELEELGYSNYTETLNAKDFGVAQNRDRVFMVSILGEYSYEFPKPFKLEKRLKDYLESYVDEKYYLSDKAIKGMFNTDYNSAKAETRIQDQDSYCSTLMARDYKDAKCVVVDDLDEPNNYLLIPEKTKDGYAKAEEGDGVYINRPYQKRGCVQKGMIQTIKASGQDVGVVVEPKRLGGLYDDENGRHQAGSIWDKDAISPTIDTMQGGHRQPFIVEDKKDMLKTTLCNQLIANGEVKEYDVIKHSYTSQILDGKKKGVEKQDEMITLTTRPDCLGVVVKEKSLNESMIDENGNVKRYLNSDIVDEFGVGDCADISFPNGYNKGNRVYKGYAPAINLTTTKDNFVVKEPTLRIRKLTPLECWRLMDIDDELFYKAQNSGISNAQLYKMAGNGIVVAVFAAIIDKLR